MAWRRSPTAPRGTRGPGRARRVASRAPGAVWCGLRAVGRGLRAVWHAPRAVGSALRAVGRGVRRLWRRWSGRPSATSFAWAGAVILSFIAFGTSGTTYDVESLGWGPMPFVGALAGLPFGLARTRPALGGSVAAGSAVAMAALLPIVPGAPWPWLVVHGLVMFALLFATGMREPFSRAAGAWALTATVFVVGVPAPTRAGWLVGVTAVALVGVLVGRVRRANVALQRQTRLGEEERAQRVRLQERARIARDLHDIVAHHMSLIVVQAETAAYRVPDLPGSAQAELTSIGAAARAALVETRSLLSVLRQEEDEPAVHEPQPGAEQIAELCAAARRAGARVDARIDVEGGSSLRPGVSLAAYRIVQEALSNAARHAPGAWVRIDVAASAAAAGPEGGDVTISVVNGPPSSSSAAAWPPSVNGSKGAEPGGHGITGMRERAAAEGGTLIAGGSAEGGFRVFATLPTGVRSASDAGDGEEPG
jgi:signal transduction histidine kinase